MTDEKFTLVETNRERANIARSARYTNRKGKGSVKSGVEYKSEKELQALNGEVKNYDLSKPMSYAEFRDMPEDLQAEYFRSLYEKHGGSDNGLRLFWGISSKMVAFYRHQFGVPPAKAHRDTHREALWKAFISVPKAFEEEAPEIEESKPMRKRETTKEKAPVHVQTAMFTVRGTPKDICRMLESLCGDTVRSIGIIIYADEVVNSDDL